MIFIRKAKRLLSKGQKAASVKELRKEKLKIKQLDYDLSANEIRYFFLQGVDFRQHTVVQSVAIHIATNCPKDHHFRCCTTSGSKTGIQERN